VAKHFADSLLQIGEVNNHAVFDLAFNRDFDLICVAVHCATFDMSRQKVSAVHVFGHT